MIPAIRHALILSLLMPVGLAAQSFNGSFEDSLGVFDDTGWTSTCTMIGGPSAPGYGIFGALVNHSNTGCGPWSRATHLVPWIGDGETWTLSGWCGVFTFPFFSPYVGFGFGWKEANGTLHFFTAPVTSNGTYTFLQVTNTFALAPGDTAFVELDPGTGSGGSGLSLFAMYDGLELTSLSTGNDGAGHRSLPVHPNPVTDRVWCAVQGAAKDVSAIASDGKHHPLAFTDREGTIEATTDALPPGLYVLSVRTAQGIATARFTKL